MTQPGNNMSRKTYESGFSLIEVLVALALFTIVVTMSVGTLLVLIDANSKAQNMQSVMTNLGYALDSMTRDIRTGIYYECKNTGNILSFGNGSTVTSDCPAGGTQFAFTESGGSLTGSSNGRIGFRLNNGAIERSVAGGSWSAVTASDITINTLKFVVTGASQADNYSPTVTIFITGSTKNGTTQTNDTFELQTTISQQAIDI